MDNYNFTEEDFTPGFHKKQIQGNDGQYYTMRWTVPDGGIDENTQPLLYVGGGGGGLDGFDGTQPQYFRDELTKNGNANAFVVNIQSGYGNKIAGLSDQINGLIDSAYSNASVDVPKQTSYSGWSAGAKGALEAAALTIKANPDNNNINVVYAVDWGDDVSNGSGPNGFSVDDANNLEMLNTLADNGTTFVAIEPRLSADTANSDPSLANRLEALKMEAVPGEELDAGFYVPKEYVRWSEKSDLTMVFATYESSGNEGDDHAVAPSVFGGSMIPSITGGDKNKAGNVEKDISGYKFDYNSSAEEEFEYYAMSDGIAVPISYDEYLDLVSGKKSVPDYVSVKRDYLANPLVSVDYEFIQDGMEALKSLAAGMNINSVNRYIPEDNGSATFKVVSDLYNNYADASKGIIDGVMKSCDSIISIAESIQNLDARMANTICGQIDSSLAAMDIDFEKYKEAFISSTTDISQGNEINMTMESLLKEVSANNEIISNMHKDIEETTKLKAEIDKFIEESNGKLQGEGWDLVRDKMDEYSEMLQEKNDYAMEFVDKTIESYKKLIEYFEDNVVLDTSTIPEVKTSIDNLTTQIEMLIAHIAELSDQWEEVTVYGDDGKPAGTMLQKVDNSALIAECNEQLDECRQVKQEMEAVLEKLEGLKGFDKALADTFTFLGLASISANSFLGGMLGRIA